MTGQIQEIDAAITAVATVAASVSGVQNAPDFELFNVNDKVFVLTYVMESSTEISETGTSMELAQIFSDVLVPFEQVMSIGLGSVLAIAKNIKKAYVYELIQHADGSRGTFFGGTIDAAEYVRLTFLPNYPYQDIQHIGYRVMIENAKLKYDL